MFGFRKRQAAPPLCPANRGIGYSARVSRLASGARHETVDLVEMMSEILRRHGHVVSSEKSFLLHEHSGFIVQPQIVLLTPTDNGEIRTTTTVQINHPRIAPAGVFEYQHASGDTVTASISHGFAEWVQSEFVTLLDALKPDHETCMTFMKNLPATQDRPALVRRVVLGPVVHFRFRPESADSPAHPESHPFCPCCLFASSLAAFESLVESDRFYGLRLYAARGDKGQALADCRVNGEDWEPGTQSLREYVATWPDFGPEFRKQYVVVHTLEST